jgi:hypothetical protein
MNQPSLRTFLSSENNVKHKIYKEPDNYFDKTIFLNFSIPIQVIVSFPSGSPRPNSTLLQRYHRAYLSAPESCWQDLCI